VDETRQIYKESLLLCLAARAGGWKIEAGSMAGDANFQLLALIKSIPAAFVSAIQLVKWKGRNLEICFYSGEGN